MSWEYNNYLEEHISNVKKGFDWLSENLPDIIWKGPGLDTAYGNIVDHDKSKYDEEEYPAYDRYFYGGNKSFQVMQDFNKAWLHHIHKNPHHWQHWVLINDDEKDGTVAIAMPYCYIIEMVCDWWSFSWKTGKLEEIFNWYEQHKDRMILEEQTRKTVENILEKIREKLKKMSTNG